MILNLEFLVVHRAFHKALIILLWTGIEHALEFTAVVIENYGVVFYKFRFHLFVLKRQQQRILVLWKKQMEQLHFRNLIYALNTQSDRSGASSLSCKVSVAFKGYFCS